MYIFIHLLHVRSLKCAVNTRVGVEWEQPLLTKCPNGYAPHTASDSKVLTLPSRNHFAVELIAAGFPASMRQDMGQVTQTLTWRTKVGDVRPWAFFRKP